MMKTDQAIQSTTTINGRRRYEEDGDFYTGSVSNGGRVIRLLCFRDHRTKAVGASPRFSRAEAWRRSRRGLLPVCAKGAAA